MTVDIRTDIARLRELGLLDRLLIDRTTDSPIVWGTDAYSVGGYGRDNAITVETVSVIQTRAQKDAAAQSERTRAHAEVFTPLWVCRMMINWADGVWRRTQDDPNDWQSYVDSRRLELTCGKGPFLMSRYNVDSGEAIPLKRRTGLLDRKLRLVNERASSEDDWRRWAMRAVQSVYGFEYQGDNLLIARVNLLMTYVDWFRARWKRDPLTEELTAIVDVLTWNLWQMDGLTGTVVGGRAEAFALDQTNLFADDALPDDESLPRAPCCIFDWQENKSLEYLLLQTKLPFREDGESKMHFDFLISNPPYQDDTVGEQKTFAPPVYHILLEFAYKVADVVEMIHPARFLFNAGSTPKEWNRKMLNDSHLKVLWYEPDSSKVFRNTDIKGGVAVTLRDVNQNFGAIGTFTIYPELNLILQKIRNSPNFRGLNIIAVTSYAYHFTEEMHKDHPEAASQLSSGHAFDLKSNVLERLSQIFFDEQPDDGMKYIKIIGRVNNKRVYKFIREDYINQVKNLYKYKVFLPAASGNGQLGETITSPMIGHPGVGNTETFMSIGSFETEDEASNLLKYS